MPRFNGHDPCDDPNRSTFTQRRPLERPGSLSDARRVRFSEAPQAKWCRPMNKLMTSVIGGLTAFVATTSARSQEVSQSTLLTLPIRPDDIGSYCIFESRVYSPGAQVCLDVVRSGSPAQAALVCKSPATGGGRAIWEASGTFICSPRAPR